MNTKKKSRLINLAARLARGECLRHPLRCEVAKALKEYAEKQAELEAAAKLPRVWRLVSLPRPRLVQDVPYVPLHDDRTFWAVWRYDEDHDWQVSPCRQPTTGEEIEYTAANRLEWLVDGPEDECEIHRVCDTKEAAQAAISAANRHKEHEKQGI